MISDIKRILINDLSGHPFQIQLSRALAARGHRVLHTYCESFLTPKGSLSLKEGDAPDFSIQSIRLNYDFEKYALYQRWRGEREVGKRLGKIVREFEPGVVISSNMPLIAQARLLAASKRVGAGFVFWMQDAFGIGYRNILQRKLPLLGDWLGRGFQAYERRLLCRADEVVVIAEDFLDYLPREVNARDSATVIENWAPLDELPLEPKTNAWSEANGLNTTFNFLYSGTLGLKHNPALLYNLAKCVAQQPNVRIVVISEGIGADWLAQRKRDEELDNLILLSFQPFQRMPEVLGAADILLALLEKDASVFAVPSKVLTYLCAQRPLLLAVPAENLSARIIEANNAGVIVEPDDAESFAAAGLELLQDKRQRNRLAANGRAYAERTFDIDLIADRFEAIINRFNAPTAIRDSAGHN